MNKLRWFFSKLMTYIDMVREFYYGEEIDELDKIVNEYFGYLMVEYGFTVKTKEYIPEHMGYFKIKLEKDAVQLTIQRDRRQIFMDFSSPKIGTQDKESILEKLGVSRERYPIISGLWTGYEIQKQSVDLKKYLPMILDYVNE